MIPSSCSRSMPWEIIEITPVAAAIRSNQTSPRASVMRSWAFSWMSSLSTIVLAIELHATSLDNERLVLWTLDVGRDPDLLVLWIGTWTIRLVTPMPVNHKAVAVLHARAFVVVLMAVAAQMQHLHRVDALGALALATSL